MSTLDSVPEVESAEEPAELTLRRMVCAIDYAEGFWLGFAESNTPAQRRRLSAQCQDLLEPLKIRVLEIGLDEPVTDLLPVLRERLAQEAHDGDAAPPEHKLAIFVYGLERSIPSREDYPPLLSALNLKRELFRQEVPHPLLLWLPDFALTALARQAPDFWAWRSGLYEFPPEREAAEQSLEVVRGQALHEVGGLSAQAKRERLLMLKGLLDDYFEMGDGPHERGVRANILSEIGMMYRMLGDWNEAEQAYEKSLAAARAAGSRDEEAAALHNLAEVAHDRGEIDGAHRLYGESLRLRKEAGNVLGVAYTLHDMGRLARDTGQPEEARRLYQESLELKRRVGSKQLDVALALYELGALAQEAGDFAEARRLFNESLAIEEKYGAEGDMAYTLHQLGRLAEDEGRIEEAVRLYNESLEIKQRLGERRGIAISLHELGRLAQKFGDISEARRLYGESLRIKEDIGDKRGIAYTLHQLGTVAQDAGEAAEARRLYNQSLEIKREICDPVGAAMTLHQLGLLAESEGDRAEAERLLRESIDTFERLGSPHAEAARKSLARVEGREDSPA